MNVKEYAEVNNMTQAEVKEKFGLTHWKQEVPESCDEIPEVVETVDISEKVVVETESKEGPTVDFAKSQEIMKLLIKDGTTPEKALAGIRLIGKKCKWYEHKEALEMLV